MKVYWEGFVVGSCNMNNDYFVEFATFSKALTALLLSTATCLWNIFFKTQLIKYTETITPQVIGSIIIEYQDSDSASGLLLYQYP